MELKRIFNRDGEGNPTTVSHIKLVSEPKNGRWNVSQRVINQGLEEGWLSIVDGHLVIKTAEGAPDVRYKIVRKPGYYCVFCGEPVDATNRGLTASGKAHMSKHAGEELAKLTAENKLPEGCTPEMIDQINNPAGYGKFNHFACQRVQ